MTRFRSQSSESECLRESGVIKVGETQVRVVVG